MARTELSLTRNRKGQGLPEYLAMGAVLLILCILFVAYMFQSENPPQIDTETPTEIAQPQVDLHS